MPKKYTSEQFWKLYEKLPQELKDALFAEETGNAIYDICKRNEVEENLDQIVEYVGQVLVGVLPPDEFQEILEKELKLEKDVTKRVNRDINRFIFYPVKSSLEELYKIEIAPPAEIEVSTPREVIPPSEAIPPQEEKPETTKREDVYREPIE